MEQNTKKISRSLYYKTFYAKHHDKVLKKHTCEFCGGSFNYYTKTQHRKSLKCIRAREGEEAYKQARIAKIQENN